MVGRTKNSDLPRHPTIPHRYLLVPLAMAAWPVFEVPAVLKGLLNSGKGLLPLRHHGSTEGSVLWATEKIPAESTNIYVQRVVGVVGVLFEEREAVGGGLGLGSAVG